MKKAMFLSSASLILLTCFALLLSACNKGPATNTPANNTSAQSTPVASPLTGFQRDLQFIRNGQFKYVFVFSRKDGKPLDKEDGAFLRTNAPQVVDWVTTEEGKKVIAGANLNLEEGGMAQLRKRFVVEDLSAGDAK